MPFDPLPKTLTDLLDAGASRPLVALDLGCGDGRLSALLRKPGVHCFGLDRLPRVAGSRADIVADARRAPVCAGSVDLVVAGNLVRHLLPAQRDAAFLDDWLALLRPGGSLFILEDEPTARPSAAANYRDLQAFLARLWPVGRGPLVTLDTFRRRLPARLAALVVESGTGANHWPQDAAAAVAMLERGRPAPGDEAHRLAAAITARGLSCGRQWWCRLRTPSPTD